ncbi:energy transducer TonB [Persephonella sp.]
MKREEWIEVFKKINIYLLIGFVVSVLIHLTVFGFLISIERKKEEKEEKPIYVYLSDFKEEKTKKPVAQRKIPKKSEMKEKKSKPLPKQKPQKKEKKEQKIVKPVINEKVVEKTEEKKVEPITEKRLDDVDLKDVPVEDEISESVDLEEIPDFSPKNEESSELEISKFEGNDEIFQAGKEEIVEEEKSDPDIMAYIKALERYLNNLAKKRDLYPPMAKRLRIEGSLILRFTILEDGSVDPDSIVIISSSGYNVLDKGATKLIEKYVPEFAKKYGKKPPNGELTIELPVTFEIIGW